MLPADDSVNSLLARHTIAAREDFDFGITGSKFLRKFNRRRGRIRHHYCRSSTMIHVLATIELAPGKRDAFLAEFRKLVPEVKAEDGCLEYGPAIDAETDIATQAHIGDNKVVIVEQWENIAALKAHSVAPHMQAYRARVKDYVKGMELRVLEPV
jgi:quinol monooxygenase YgiN